MTLKTFAFCLLFLCNLSSAENEIKPNEYRSIEFLSTRQIDINVSGAQYTNGNFVTRAKGLSTNLIYQNRLTLSYNAIIQYPLIFVANFNAYPTSTDLPIISALNLLNGEVGYKFYEAEIGLNNSFNFYFTRRAYHRTGLYIRYGKSASISLMMHEDDRVNSAVPKIGVGIMLNKKINKLFFE